MPNRILHECICVSDRLDGLSWFEEILFYRLIVNCDDYGRFDGRTAVIKNRLFPLKESLTMKAVAGAIDRLASAGLVSLYEFEGKPYLCLPDWNAHQTIRAKRSRYPAPPWEAQTSERSCMQMHADAPVIQSESISVSESGSVSGSNAAQGAFSPPTVEEVEAYGRERNSPVRAREFWDFYAAKGWRIGQSPMRDWRAAFRSAERWDRWKKPEGAKKAPGGAQSAADVAETKRHIAQMQRFLEREAQEEERQETEQAP